MAGERRGKAYEAVVLVALEALRAKAVFVGEIFWEKTPHGMSIKPDLTIGLTADEPTYSILVTYSGSAKESEKKMWRNFGELTESKTCLQVVPRVFALTFGAIKEDLAPLQEWAFDEFRWSRGSAWHRRLALYAGELESNASLAASDFPGEVRVSAPREVMDSMISLLEGCFLAPIKPAMTDLWLLQRARTVPAAPSPRETHVRRGIGKLLVFEDLDLGAALHDGVRFPKDAVPEYAVDLKLCAKSIREAWGLDLQVRSAVQCLGREAAVALAKRSSLPNMDGWYYTLRNKSIVPHLATYIRDNHDNLCRPDWLQARLIELHDSPSALVSAPAGVTDWPPRSIWLFELLIQLIRAASGSANGFGYAQLAGEVLSRFGGRSLGGGEPRLFRVVLPDWLHRRGAETLSDAQLLHVASVLSDRLSKVPKAKLAAVLRDLAAGNAKHLLETKLLPYRLFDPLGELLKERIAGFEEIRVNVCYREAAGVGRQAGKMVVGRAARTLINWQSCTDSGRDHKKKELCGRAVGLRYHWSGNTFVRRPGVDKLILLLDGTWRGEDLKALLRAGWDEIFYPDEMDRLVKAIV